MSHLLGEKEVAKKFGSSLTKGLTDAKAAELLAKHGRNELEQAEATPIWKLILEQFDDLLVKILLASAGFSFLIALYQGSEEEGLAAFVEPAVILLILILNAGVGVWQESNAENALEALKELQPKHTVVVRNNVLLPEFACEELVPGDLVEIKVGNKVPADMRVVEFLSTTLRIDESALTGESATVLKQVEALTGDADIRVSSKVTLPHHDPRFTLLPPPLILTIASPTHSYPFHFLPLASALCSTPTHNPDSFLTPLPQHRSTWSSPAPPSPAAAHAASWWTRASPRRSARSARPSPRKRTRRARSRRSWISSASRLELLLLLLPLLPLLPLSPLLAPLPTLTLLPLLLFLPL
jgi:hypothetical protein